MRSIKLVPLRGILAFYSLVFWACQGDPSTISVDVDQFDRYQQKYEDYFARKPDSALYYLDLSKNLVPDQVPSSEKWLLHHNYSRHYFFVGNYSKAIDYCLTAKKTAEQLGDSLLLAKTLNVLGNVQHHLGNYVKAQEHFHRSLKLLESVGDLASTAVTLTNIGLLYKDMSEYEKALQAFDRCLTLDLQFQDTFGIMLDYNHKGIILKKFARYEEAMEMFDQSLAIAEEIDDPLQKAIVFNNMGLVENELGHYPKAIEYLDKALQIKKELKLDREMAITANFLSEVYLNDLQWAKSEAMGQEALTISKQTGVKDQISKAYDNLSKVAGSQGRYRDAYAYLTQHKVYNDSILNEARLRQTKEIEASYQTGKQEEQIASLVLANKNETLKRNAFAGGLIASVLLGGMAVVILRIRIRKNRQIQEKEKEVFDQQIKNYENDLAYFTRSLVDKNNRIEELNLEVAKTKKDISKACPNYGETIDHLFRSTILTDEEWLEFKKRFIQVHAGFFTNLRDRYPGLTETEERLMALTKLKLTNKEIAGMLGISTESVNKSRYRLRKKLEMAPGEMEEVLSEV